MELINYDHFYWLKLGDFIANKNDIRSLDDWEFMNDIWQGESVGFSEWIQLKNGAKEKSIAIDFTNLSKSTTDKMLLVLKLNVRKGMTKEEVIEQFGAPLKIDSYISDRVSFEFIIGGLEKYYLSLTLSETEGLIYLVLMNHSATINALMENSSS